MNIGTAQDEDIEYFYDWSPYFKDIDWANRLNDGSVLVDVSSKKFPEATMLVDQAMATRYCTEVKWCVDSSTGYAVAKVNGKKLSFHRLILNAPKGVMVDHINRDKLDNRMSNLRFVSGSRNAQNRRKAPGKTSSYIGVSKRSSGMWYATIRVRNKTYHLGSFENEIDAARTYNKHAQIWFGPDAQINQLSTGEPISDEPGDPSMP